MSRDLTTAFKNAVTAGTVTPIELFVAEFDSETLRFWNGYGTLTYDSNDYTGAGHLLKSSPIIETQKTEARGVNFELNGIPSSKISVALNEHYQDRPVTHSFALLDANDTIIADPFAFFKGKADVMEIEEGKDSATIKLSAESDLVALTRANERRRTPEDQKINHPGDTFFDNVASLQTKDVIWGKGA